jgi:hypothetical protein
MNVPLNKLKTYIYQYFERDDIAEQFESLRKKVGIPAQGFKPLKKFTPIDTMGPTVWVNKLMIKGEVEFNGTFKIIDSGIKKISKDFKYTYVHQIFLFRLFFFYNKIVTTFLDDKFLSKGNFYISAVHPLDALLKQKGSGELFKENRLPIVIQISPFLTKNDLVSLIKNNWQDIEYLKTLYTNERLNFRGRITRERDNFIYKNQYLPRKKISQLVWEKFGQRIDAMQVRKIISRKKKSKKV